MESVGVGVAGVGAGDDFGDHRSSAEGELYARGVGEVRGVARGQIWLELARPGDATQLGGEGAVTGRGCRGPSRRWSLVLVRPACRYCR